MTRCRAADAGPSPSPLGLAWGARPPRDAGARRFQVSRSEAPPILCGAGAAAFSRGVSGCLGFVSLPNSGQRARGRHCGLRLRYARLFPRQINLFVVVFSALGHA